MILASYGDLPEFALMALIEQAGPDLTAAEKVVAVMDLNDISLPTVLRTARNVLRDATTVCDVIREMRKKK